MSSSGSDAKESNEIRVRKNVHPLKFVYEAFCMFGNEEEVVLTGIGQAINHVVEVAEMIKRRMKNVHQLCELGMKAIASRYPGGNNSRNRRRRSATADSDASDSYKQTAGRTKHVCYIKITLSKTGKGINKDDVGYQGPLDEREVNVLTIDEVKKELEDSRFAAKKRSQRRDYRGQPAWSNRKHRSGRDRYGRDRYDRDRYDRDRYDRDRYDQDRYDRDRYDRDRYDRDRYDRDRYDRDRYDRDRYDRSRYEKDRHNRDRYRRDESYDEERKIKQRNRRSSSRRV